MAGQRFEIDVDPNFEIHTSYHNDFFLLRTRVLVNGENMEIRSVREGKYEGPVLNFCHSGSTISTKLHLVASTVSPILAQQFGVYHVDTFYYEQSPLFHVVFSSESCLKNFILAIEEVKSALEPKLQSLLSSNLKTPSAQQLTVKVHLDLFLVSPNHQLIKGAEVHLVTTENCSDFVTRWKNSKLFDFETLYKEEAKPPKVTFQPMSQRDVLPGKAVKFSIQASGTQPLSYQWQQKQFGKKGDKYGWQNLSGKGSTFQVMEVKASNAGYYRCVVSNSAGSETSQCASLTIVPEVHDLESELHDVIDWIPFGLYLGIQLPKLKTIEANHPTLQRRRIEMLEEWQNNVIPTWFTVVQALLAIGMKRLASELAQKHGTPPPKLPDHDPLDQLENILQQEEEATAPKLLEEFQKHRGDQLEQDRRKLVVTEERLIHAQESKAEANNNTSKLVAKLEELHENMQKIAQDKNSIEVKLKCKERECELLSKMQGKDEMYNQLLQTIIEKKKNKIKRLKEELQKKECELKSALQEVQTKQEELSQARKEVKKRHEEVMQLQREKEEVAWSYNIEKEQVSKIVQLLVSDKEEMQQQLTSMIDGSELMSQQIEAYNTEISQLSKEIEVLSSSLQEKEATAAQLQNELQTHQQVSSTQLLGLTTQIVELEHRLQEAEEQKHQVELEKDTTVQEMNARQIFKVQLRAQLDEPPKVTNHLKNLSKVLSGKPVTFTAEVTGTKPLNYHWEWKPAKEEGGSKEWQPCRAEWCDGATLTIPSVQKSNEGSYRCVISNYAGSQTSNPAKLEMLQLPLQLRWRRYTDMEYRMSHYPQCVVLERSVYVGGGRTCSDDDGYCIQVYDMDADNWSRLPTYKYKFFAVTIINNHLTLVGGVVDGPEVTDQLAVYEPSSQHWTYPYHPMPTPRYFPAVLVHDIWLLVAGGRNGWTDLASVELFNTSTNQWLAASSLPTPCGSLTSAIMDNYGYIVMSSKQVFRVSLPDIVSQSVEQYTASQSPALWCPLPDTLLSYSAAISLHGYLLAVGGSHDNGTRSKAIYLYQPENEQWTKVGDLPNARFYCSCVVLPSGELLVAGGQKSSDQRTSRVDVACVLD